MYESFYGLNERPFDITPNPRFLYLTPRHREALSNLKYGLSSQKALTLLLGEAGTGKTTIVRAALQGMSGGNLRYVYLNNPTLTRSEFYDYLATGLGLSAEAAGSKSKFLFELQRHATDRQRTGGATALIIDEAQSLPDVLLEEIRLLANTETTSVKLLPLLLVGQPELAERLNEPQLRQLKQRVALRCSLGPLSLQESAAYIAGRIRIAGGNAGAVFTRDAVLAIFEHSRGIPRTISVICDNALLNGFAVEARPVGEEIIREVVRDFDLNGSTPQSVPLPARPSPRPALADPDPHAAASLPLREAASVAVGAEEATAGLFSGFRKRRKFRFF